MIAFGRYVNPSFTFKYGISESFDLMVFNFTDTDQGRYMCKGIANEEFKQHAVMVNLCNVPDEINYVTYEPKENRSNSRGKILCKDDTKTQNNDKIYQKAIISILKVPLSQQNIDERDENTLTGTLMEYKCMTLNADNCVISDNTFKLNIEWVLRNETTKEIAVNNKQLYVYTCERNDSNTTEELPSNDTLHIYYLNKTVYLRDPENYATGCFECVLVENDVSEKTTTFPDIELKTVNKIKNNADNIARLVESQNCPAEGYSSIDRRHRIEVGQMVSYKASGVSGSSIANESGHILAVSSDGGKGRQTEETNGDDNLTVQHLKNITSGQNNTEASFLNYIEVEFNTDTVSPKFHINGSGNETPYADIDLTMTADPLPESDSSDEEGPDTKSEFMTLYDIYKPSV
ncbi:unnamed protein product [Mytilus edulis]|uniref:Uncharacterized protein n=1 Tax=Mytilus edulis TaxID=6550 RepID=A0A8S3TZV4_MYTED|nr:unnamed protein product [Mytilus edulis]